MALVDNAWYVNFGDGSTTGYYAVTQWATGTVTAAGAVRRQKTTPTFGNERCFVCVVAGTTHATTEPTWVVTRGAKTTDNTVTWQECTGVAAINGDLANTPTWTTVKNTAVTLGQVIQRVSGASYQICTTAGTAGNGAEPAFSDTAGTTTADNTVTWTSLGAVGNFTGWQYPHARIKNACTATWQQAGNKVFVASASAETSTSATTISVQSSRTLPTYILCTSTASAPPTATTTGASVSIGAATAAMALQTSGAGLVYWDGISLNSATNNSGTSAISVNITANSAIMVLKNCSLAVRNTSANLLIGSTGNPCDTTLENVDVTLGSGTTPSIFLRSRVWWKGGTLSLGATKPTSLFTSPASTAFTPLIEGVDLSAFTGTNLLSDGSATGNLIVKDCKLGAFTNLTTGATDPASAIIDIIRSDSSNTTYNLRRNTYAGEITTETTTVRTGGATDGVTTVSWKFVTSSTCYFNYPLMSAPIRIWNDTTGSAITVTIYGAGASTPTDAELQFEVEYLGDASFPLASRTTAGQTDYLATGSSWTTDGTSSWGGAPAAVFKKTSASFTPQQKGYIYIYIRAIKASATYYIDPKPVLG